RGGCAGRAIPTATCWPPATSASASSRLPTPSTRTTRSGRARWSTGSRVASSRGPRAATPGWAASRERGAAASVPRSTRRGGLAGGLVGAVGRVLPATTEPVVLKADVEGLDVEGQVAVSNSLGRIRRLDVVPTDAAVCPDAVAAIGRADQVLLAPGSLYTSL